MTTNGAEILIHPHPSGHIVYSYTEAAQMVEAVGLFASAGIRQDEAVLLIMTAGHRQPIEQRLEAEGFDVPALEASGQLVCEDAEHLMSTFLLDGKIDEQRFKIIVGRMIERAKIGRQDPHRAVRVFGEMVDLLWHTDLRSTQRLEELWNEVIETHAVPLLCAYSLAGIKPDAIPQPLLASHSHVAA